MTICVRSDGGVERRELGPNLDLDIENSVFGGESNSIEARESRLAMNIRFLGSKPAVDIDMNDVDAKIDERERPPSLSEGIRGWGIDVAREGAVPAGSQYTVTHLRKTSNRMFVERMEEIFGTAGSMGRGSGGKPKENVGSRRFALGFLCFFWLVLPTRELLLVRAMSFRLQTSDTF
jgi:hypothetical protein